VLGDLPRHPGAVGHVRRVRDDDGDPPVELREKRRIGHVALDDADRCVPRAGARQGVVPRPGDGARVALDRRHPRAGVLVRDGQREGSGAAAQVDDDRPGGVGESIDRPAGQQLGLRPWDEDARADRQLEEAKRGAAGEVLKRHAVGPLPDERPEPRDVVVGHLVEREEPAARDAEDVGEQQFGVHPGRFDLCLGEPPGGVGQQCPGVQEPAASSSAVCAPTSASITASRSPSMTWSRLCAL
jgi:hypothetical protein